MGGDIRGVDPHLIRSEPFNRGSEGGEDLQHYMYIFYIRQTF